MKYCAIDFETASTTQDSACAIGLVRYEEDGTKIDGYYSLIRPRHLCFDPICTAVHHLDPLDIARAPRFSDIWEDVRDFIGPLPLVAHNAEFDIKCLRESLGSWGIEPCHNLYYDTLSLSRKLWKDKDSYKLTNLAADFGWVYDAHNALADAEICGRLFSRLCGNVLFDDDETKRFFRRLYKTGSKGFPRKV